MHQNKYLLVIMIKFIRCSQRIRLSIRLHFTEGVLSVSSLRPHLSFWSSLSGVVIANPLKKITLNSNTT